MNGADGGRQWSPTDVTVDLTFTAWGREWSKFGHSTGGGGPRATTESSHVAPIIGLRPAVSTKFLRWNARILGFLSIGWLTPFANPTVSAPAHSASQGILLWH